jgi:phosphoribosylformylglycinamidine cyclo-ligase
MKYDKRGVSADKHEVHAAIENLDKGLFPNAFCKILPDFVGGNPKFVNLMHADTAGTKTSLAYLYWKETGDLSVWEGISQDAIVMNLDDMGCVGCVDNILLSSTIGRNKLLISGDVIGKIINATEQFIKKMAAFGIHVHSAGGETADVGDIVRTIDVGYTAFARLPRKSLIINNLRAGDVIVGLASYGQSTYENEYNSGMGSNGLTGARHDVLSKIYSEKYPESHDPNLPSEVVYTGKNYLTDLVEIDGKSIPVGKLLLSPTRTFLPFLKKLLESHRSKIHGIIHNTGGGQTKVMKFAPGFRVEKTNPLPIPPLFNFIQKASKTDWREMYQVFNMGCRLEIYLSKKDAEAVLEIAKSFNIDAQIIGKVKKSTDGKASVFLKSPHGKFEWSE